MLFRNKEKRSQGFDMNDKELLQFLGIEINGLSQSKLKEASYFTCLRILCDTVSKLPLKLYFDTNNGIQKANDHYLYSILKLRPNPYMSASDFWKCIEFQRNHFGNAVVYIECDRRGKIQALYPLEDGYWQMWIDDAGILSKNNNVIWYVIKDKLGKEYKVQASEVLHFKGFTENGLIGKSVREYLLTTIENAQSGQQYLNNYFKNGLFAKGLLQYTGDIDEEAQKNMQQRFEKMANGIKNAGKILPVPLGFSFQTVNSTMADAQFFELSTLTCRQIAAAFGIKMHQLNDLERSTHTNIAEQQKEFYIDTLMSTLNMYEQESTYKLLLKSELDKNHFFRFNVDSILRANIKERFEAYRIGIQSGFMKINEARELENWTSEEDGNNLICNGNMQKVKDVGVFYKNNLNSTQKGGEIDENE